MSTELAQINQSELSVLPPAQPVSLHARQMLMAHAEMMQQAHQLATAMCNTQMVPTRFRGKPDDGAAAILYGSELGLTPIQSLQRIVPIHGMPSLEARTMVALLKSRGYRIQTVDQSDDRVSVAGASPSGESAESTWTIDRARKAGYVPEIDEKTKKYKLNANGKMLGNEKYLTDPQAMLKAKAQAEVCRELAPDVLMGISYTSEELESERWDDSALPPAPFQRPAAAAVTADEILGVIDEPVVELEPEKPVRKPRARKEPETVAEVDDLVETASDPVEKRADAQVSDNGEATETDLRKSARGKLTGAIFSIFGDVGLGLVANREDRLIVIAAIVGHTVTSSNELTDDELQNLRNGLYSRQQAGTLEADINDWLNIAALKEMNAAESTENEGN